MIDTVRKYIEKMTRYKAIKCIDKKTNYVIGFEF